MSAPFVLLCFLLGLSAAAPPVRGQTNPQPTSATLTTTVSTTPTLPLSSLRLLPADELLSGAPAYNPTNLGEVAKAIIRITGCQSERNCSASAGSGVIIHPSGVILTAWHVTVADPGPVDAPNLNAPPLAFFKIETTAALGRGIELRYRARLIASNPEQDLALLRVYWDEATQRPLLVDSLNNLPHLALRDASEADLTNWYQAQTQLAVMGYAIGDRNLSSFDDTISRLDLVNNELGLQRQLSKGFSGGPLLVQNERYEVVGVVIRRSGELGERAVIRTINSATSLTWQPEATQNWGENFVATLAENNGIPQLVFRLDANLLDFVGQHGQLRIQAIDTTSGEAWLPSDPAQLTVNFTAQHFSERQPLTVTLSPAGQIAPFERLLFKPFLWDVDEARLLWQSDRWYGLGTPTASASTPTPTATATPDLAATQTAAAQAVAVAVAATLTALPTATPPATPNLAATQTALAQAIDVAIAATLTGLPTVTPTPSKTPIPTASPTPAEPAAGATRTNPIDGAVYVYVPAGEFLMGSADSDADAGTDEKPQHTVYLDGFWIMRTEVTNTEYAACVKAGACTEPTNKRWNDQQYADHPVTDVTRQQANAYAQWAGGRLPSEAEWEKAARGTDRRIYPWGNQPPTNQLLNFNKQVNDTKPAGSYPDGASPYGAWDMAGNVLEWVSDWYAEDYYQHSPARNPQGPDKGSYYVLRGGSWYNGQAVVRAASRSGFNPDSRDDGVGIRVVRSLSPGF